MSLVICDDHEMFLDALRQALVGRSHEIAATTGDPTEVSQLVDQYAPSLALLDVHLPGLTGVDLARELRKRHRGIRIVLLTGSNEDWVHRAYQDRVVDGLIAKNTDVRTLDRNLRLVLGGERVLVGWSTSCAAAVRGATAVDRLTVRERQVLLLIADGETTDAIAGRLGVSTNTVRTYVAGVLRKLGVHQRTKAAHAAVQLGLVPSS